MATHSNIYYYNNAVDAGNWNAAANYLIADYTAGDKPWMSGAANDIQHQKLVPLVVINTLDPQVAGIYQFLVKIGFLTADSEVDTLISSGKLEALSSAIPATTLAAVAANQLAAQQIQTLQTSVSSTSASSGVMLLGIVAVAAIALFRKKKKT